MFRVTREFKFCFGHRLMEYPGKCRQLHGHNGRAFVTVGAKKLDRLGMAMDFGQIKRIVSKWIDETLDHTTVLHRDDPMLAKLTAIGESAPGLDVNPTTENLAKLIFDQAYNRGVPVLEVALWENDASCAVYSPDGSFTAADEQEEAPATALVRQPERSTSAQTPAATYVPSGGPYFVTREIKFCFGHRLVGYPGKCRRIHGHNARVLLTVEAAELDDMGMATDFVQLKRGVQHWLDDLWDDRMLLQRDDPLIPVLEEFDSPVFALDENPTTENLAKRIFAQAAESGLNPVSVQFWETDSCSAGFAPAMRTAVAGDSASW